MGWLRRQRAEAEGIGPHDSSRPVRAVGPLTHDAPALAEILGSIDEDRPVHLLDLGPAAPANLEFFDTFASSVFIAHLLRDLEPYDPDHPEDTSFVDSLGRLEPSGRAAFDLILIWDTLDYLTANRASVLCHHLAAVARRGAFIHALTSAGSGIPARPAGYEIVGPGLLRRRPGTGEKIEAPAIAPAAVERRLAPFRITRSVLLRNGAREFVGVLD